MKKISILFVSILLINLFSGCQFDKSTEYDAVDLSYEHILELNHFKCYASYLDQETTIEGEEAKELYKIVSESNEGIEHSPSSSQNDYIYLVFYNSTSGYPSTDERTEFYGSYYIYSDGLLQFSGSPYHSAVFSYKLKNNIFAYRKSSIFIIFLCRFKNHHLYKSGQSPWNSNNFGVPRTSLLFFAYFYLFLPIFNYSTNLRRRRRRRKN